jgi:hypothetical protein
MNDSKSSTRLAGSDPKFWLCFVELDPFGPAWKKLGLRDGDLRDLQISLCFSPSGSPIIQGTGGLRKLRFAPKSWKMGQSGAVRVYYVYFQKFGLIALVLAHAKNERESISESQKRQVKALIEEIESTLGRKFRPRGDRT